ESSGTSFFLYGLAWGLNNGILDQNTYLPVVEKAWNFFATTAIQPSGRLGYVQPSPPCNCPGPTSVNDSADYGVGAFLLAAHQMALLAPASVAPSIAATAGTPQSAIIGATFGTPLQATVKDASNNPEVGVTVTFTAPSSGASGTFVGGVNTATTNGSGIAALTFTANTLAGNYSVTASAPGVTTPAIFNLTNLPGSAANIAAAAGTSQGATIKTAFATALAAKVTDASNNPVSGVPGTFLAPGSGPSGTFSNGTATITVTTTSTGVATAAFTANSVAGGPYTVTAIGRGTR